MIESKSNSVLNTMLTAPIVPTVLPLSTDILGRYARVLFDEGYPCLELLSRPLDRALEIFREICIRPERQMIHWGIGTILTEGAARQAVELGPDFLVSPAFSCRVLRVARQAGIPYIPGVRTFQDVQDVLEAFEDEGLTLQVLKLCPIEGLTPGYVGMLASCFPSLLFCPTGEVTTENYRHWKSLPCVGTPMGSQFVPQSVLEERDFDEVRRLLRSLRALSAPRPFGTRPRRQLGKAVLGKPKTF